MSFRDASSALLRKASEDTQPILGKRWYSVAFRSVAFFLVGTLLYFLSGAEISEIMDEVIRYIFYVLAAIPIVYFLIFIKNLFAAPFRLHYAEYYLHKVEEEDRNNLQRALVLKPKQIKISGPPKRSPFLLIHFGIFNGSVYSLKCNGVTGEAPLLHDMDSGEEIALPRAKLTGKRFNDLHHAQLGELSIEIEVTNDLVDKIQGILSRQTEGHNSGRFDLRGVAIELTTKETKETHLCHLPAIDMGTAERIGLGFTMSTLDG